MSDDLNCVLEVTVNEGRKRRTTPLERVAASEDQRKAEWERRKEASRENKDPRECAKTFLDRFAAKCEEIKMVIRDLHAISCQDQQHIRTSLEHLSTGLIELEKSIAQSAYFLSGYDVRQSGLTVQELRGQIEEAQQKLLPKRKFAFSKRTQQPEGPMSSVPRGQEKKAINPEPIASKDDGVGSNALQKRGLQGLQGQDLCVSGQELGNSDYSLVDLEDCTVLLLGVFSALHIRNLKNCKVVAGAITGATLLADVDSCTLLLASSQVRIHSTRDTQFYLRVRSNPVIEHSHSVGVAPLPEVEAEGWSDCLAEAQLDEENEMWCRVNDFGWLRASQSPNWHVIAPDQRQSFRVPPTQ